MAAGTKEPDEMNAKQRIQEAVDALPDNATVEEAIERLYFLAKVERGLEQANAGQTVPHDEARRRLLR
jgi:predicted transcriptional regulator